MFVAYCLFCFSFLFVLFFFIFFLFKKRWSSWFYTAWQSSFLSAHLVSWSGWNLSVTPQYLRVILFTEQTAINEAKPFARIQLMMACDTGETFDVVYIPLNSHHQFSCWDVLPARRASAPWSKHSDIVVFTKDHSTFCETGRSKFSKWRLAAIAFQTTCVPIMVDCMEHKPIANTPSTTKAHFQTSRFISSISWRGHYHWLTADLRLKDQPRVDFCKNFFPFWFSMPEINNMDIDVRGLFHQRLGKGNFLGFFFFFVQFF